MKTRLITFQIEILRSRASGQHRTFSFVLLLPDTIMPRLFQLYLIHFHLGKANSIYYSYDETRNRAIDQFPNDWFHCYCNPLRIHYVVLSINMAILKT